MQDVRERRQHVELHRRIVDGLGFAVQRPCTILDFGCGAGETVRELRRLGFEAYGTDIVLDGEDDHLRLIETAQGYRIPFPDDTFDFIYSDQVLEHVRDHEIAFAEMWRVLKPGGVSLHLFPPKCRPIEPHTLVPLAGVVRSRVWLSLWALLGVRNVFQRGLAPSVVAERNYAYLHQNTCYLTKSCLRRLIEARFANVMFVEREFIRRSYGRSRYLYPFVRLCPWLAQLFSSLHQRVVFFRKLPVSR